MKLPVKYKIVDVSQYVSPMYVFPQYDKFLEVVYDERRDVLY